MLPTSKQRELLSNLKNYHKQYLKKLSPELDESGTRLMINAFLVEVLGYAPLEEVKTEYMIKGTYADYVVQLRATRHFLVEVKALGFELTEKHLRQAINYGANEGIEWALLTNGKQFDLYRIIFEKPISERKVFSIDLSNLDNLKDNLEVIQYLHKASVSNKGLDQLWAKCLALDPKTIAGLLHNTPIVNFIRKVLKKKYRHSFTEDEVSLSIDQVILRPILLEDVKTTTVRKKKRSISDNSSEVKPAEVTLVVHPTIGQAPAEANAS